jgi:hypothetical protein
VRVPQRADHAVGHLKKSRRPHQHRAGRAGDVAGRAQGNVKTERDGIGVGEFNLVQIPARAENSQIGNHAAARPDERDRFFRGKLSFLIKPFVNLKLVAFAEKHFDRYWREMTMPRADVDDERVHSARGARQWLAKLGINGLSNEMFDDSAMWCWSSDSHKC